VDALIGKTGVVTKRIALHEPGMAKVGGEIWRAELVAGEDSAKEVGVEVRVESIEGVTLKVR
jgi:membrane protein implicated in regulation of membrane protease activity